MHAPCCCLCGRFVSAEEPLLQRRVEELEEMAHKEAGEVFNLGSPADVSRAAKRLAGWLPLLHHAPAASCQAQP